MKFRKLGVNVCCVALCLCVSHWVGAEPPGISETLDRTLGVRYVKARKLEKEGKVREAVKLLRLLLREVEDGPAAVPIRKRLSALYLKLQKEGKARSVLRISSGPASRPLSKIYRKKFGRFVHAQVEIIVETKVAKNGRRHVSRQVRRFKFRYSRAKRLEKILQVPMGRQERSIVFRFTPSTQKILVESFKSMGNRRVSTGKMLLRIREHGNTKGRLALRKNHSSLIVTVQASYSGKVSKGVAWRGKHLRFAGHKSKRRTRRFVANFRGGRVEMILHHLGEVNGYIVSYDKAVDRRKRVQFKVGAGSRVELLRKACVAMGVMCRINGKKLMVLPLRFRSVPTPPTPPLRPRRPTAPVPPTPSN